MCSPFLNFAASIWAPLGPARTPDLIGFNFSCLRPRWRCFPSSDGFFTRMYTHCDSEFSQLLGRHPLAYRCSSEMPLCSSSFAHRIPWFLVLSLLPAFPFLPNLSFRQSPPSMQLGRIRWWPASVQKKRTHNHPLAAMDRALTHTLLPAATVRESERGTVSNPTAVHDPGIARVQSPGSKMDNTDF